ncbi:MULTISPECIES: tyrosine-type recombinase/integrase [Pseudonocardia]|uniref:Tyrosine recombinase XerC n=2 Tax=Pseudonocardia TaxID=1847 RepID=A0A1Y2N7Y0_PSEAH|nr:MULTISPECIES: tyrosine-type recombinase/integrase [Pseudonocardia]OSY43553.1 Tyrosine recombinase XerC [Pseudonocardia autotrophica]TDN73456.1 site-specific recombinase XerD [Pseudonocardia autotrophica]BBG04196.1 tyrosine recombinase XerC [Pseudonocardia autotrophica]GEC25527.1 tyrosine recombinase XerC [Pseudonocardia saturnea]
MDELSDWVDEWAESLRTGNVTDATIVVYVRGARQFTQWLAATHPEASLADVDRRTCQRWLGKLADDGLSEATRRVRGISLRLFLGYVASEPDSGLEQNPAEGLELPVPKAPPVPVISDDDLGTLLRSMDGASFVDRRDTAIIRVLLDTGCRRGELAGLDVEDVELRHGEMMIRHAKGGKARVVPFGNRTTLALRKYLRARTRRGVRAEAGPLFIPTRVTAGREARMTGGGVRDMLARRCKAAGLGHIHPHQLRHTWAHDMLASGAGESDVERLAGWSTPLMVRRYGNSVADARARDAARRLGRGDRV